MINTVPLGAAPDCNGAGSANVVSTAGAPALSVLVADSSTCFLQAMRTAIGREPGLRLLTVAQTAASAFDCFVRHRPEVVITGVSLPDSSGFELLRSIRQADSTCLLILSSKQPDPFVVEVGRLMGADGVCRRNDEVTQLRELLRRTAQA